MLMKYGSLKYWTFFVEFFGKMESGEMIKQTESYGYTYIVD